MQVILQTQKNRRRVMWLAVALALLAGTSYLLIQLGLLGVDDLQPSQQPAVIVFIAACCWLGWLLILLRRRWLWIMGAVTSALVILFFITAYANRPAVMFSPGGLATKLAQVLLEGCLLERDTGLTPGA